jgi:protein gp37
MTKSKIEWTERVWNPTTGCNKVSPGCKNCYAEVMHKRLMKMKPDKYAKPFLDGAYSHIDTLTIPATWKKPSLIFVNSMSDLFHEDISFEFIAAVFSVMSDIDRHTYQVLTKRPKRMVDFFKWQEVRYGFQWLPSDNVWLGVSVEDQATADLRIPLLLSVTAAVRFLSCEPLLGIIKFKPVVWDTKLGNMQTPALFNGIDWVIVGGESGHKARPLNPEWVKHIWAQCRVAKVPFMFKQWGEWYPISESPIVVGFPINKKVKELHADGVHYIKVGKKLAGNFFKGKQWLGFPRANKGGQ